MQNERLEVEYVLFSIYTSHCSIYSNTFTGVIARYGTTSLTKSLQHFVDCLWKRKKTLKKRYLGYVCSSSLCEKNYS